MRRSTLAKLALLVAGLLAAAAIGCGGDDTPGPAAERPVDAIRVVETDFDLDPANPQIRNAGKVVFDVVNRGDTVHALKIETPDGGVETDRIAPAESRTLETELSPGRYTWYGPVANHRDLGMAGTVTVGGAAGGSDSVSPGTTGSPSQQPDDAETPRGGSGC